MELTDKDLKKIIVMFMMAVLAVLTYLLLKPLLVSILTGLILAYVCMPLYNKMNSIFKNRNLAASVVSLVVLAVILIPLWFIIPILIDQVFSIFQNSQSLDIHGFIKVLFPTASDQFVVQLTVTISTIISKASSGVLNYLVDFFLELPSIFFGLFVTATVFFTSMKHNETLKDFASAISPFNKSKEKIITSQFSDITESVIYGQVVIGILQGILAGIGFLLFGVKGALVLTLMAVVLSILPLGPSIIWLPVGVTFFINGQNVAGILFLLYNILVVSTFDNILRAYIVARKSSLSPVLALIGTIGGIFVFGTMGLILGPLILAYFITFLKAYKEKSLTSLFAEESK